MNPTFHRQSRTPSSEQYQILDGPNRIGHLDLHYGAREVYATLVLDRELDDQDVEELIERVDEDLVLSAEVQRDDFLVRVYVGREVGFFSDELLHEDEYSENGHDDLEAE